MERYEEFGYRYDEAVRNEDWQETYSMLDEYSQQEFTEEEWVAKHQAVRDASGPLAPLESVSAEDNEEVSDAPWTGTLYYEDGTQDNLRVMMPMAIEDMSDAYVPKRLLTEEEIGELEQVSTSGSSSPTSSDLEAGAEEAAGKYYMAAGLENWDYTYENLDASTQSRYSKGEWINKNQWFADNGSVIYHVDSVDRVGTSSEYLGVTLTLTYEDGSSSTRTTYFIYEDGEWKHRFSQEETDLFMPDASYEKFVAARE